MRGHRGDIAGDGALEGGHDRRGFRRVTGQLPELVYLFVGAAYGRRRVLIDHLDAEPRELLLNAVGVVRDDYEIGFGGFVGRGDFAYADDRFEAGIERINALLRQPRSRIVRVGVNRLNLLTRANGVEGFRRRW